ncbi:MAG: ATP-binding cassette domain-containing protein, partial [Chloroflexi bacterium]|nr:ATP-binding cassette domain-containing protein [Chloroflexota bacterium]
MNPNHGHSIELKNVTLSFVGSQPILRNLNFVIRPGEFIGIVGAPGSGKSTLLNLMAGIIPHYLPADIQGQALIWGVDTQELNLAKIATQIGVVTQDPENQLFNLLVKDEVVWALENRGYERALMEERLAETLTFFNISELRERITYDLSGGEKQRVALASTYIFRPDILILDNPTSQLDPVGSTMVIESIKKILQQHQTVIMVEDKIDELLEHADRLVFLHQGEIVLDVTPEELSQHLELLREIGIRPPEIIELGHRLRQAGMPLERTPVDLEDAVKFFQLRLNGRTSPLKTNSEQTPLVSAPVDQGEKLTDTEAASAHLVVSNLSFTYPPPRTINALKGASLAIRQGSFVAIIGKNGSGKTTLARCISGYLKPTQGKVTIGGKDV